MALMTKPTSPGLAMALAKKRVSDLRKKMWLGGEVSDIDAADDEDHINYRHFDSTGEAEEGGQFEEDRSFGHVAEKYAHGGKVKHPVSDYLSSQVRGHGEDSQDMMAGGLAKNRERQDMEEAIHMKAGGLAKTPEEEHDEVIADMYAGGLAKDPEDAHNDDQPHDPGLDDAFIEAVLRKKQRGMWRGGCA